MTLHDANHCPGAAVCLFTLRKRSSTPLRTVLHTGDFRWESDRFEKVDVIRR
jgi:Cft2 family RNA processing exonuclease